MWFVLWCVFAVATVILILHLFVKRIGLGTYNVKHDLTGKVVIVTGASAGIGKETARELAQQGATVYMACRNLDKAEKAAQEIRIQGCKGKLVVMLLELTSFSSVRKFVEEFKARENRLDILVNNAGIGGFGRSKHILTEDGIEEVMQTNHFGPFLLTLMLLDLLKQSGSSRIVNVSSMAHGWAKPDVSSGPSFQNSEVAYSGHIAYCNSKLANILFTRSLARRLVGSSVTTNSLHPGAVMTEFGRDIPFVSLLQSYGDAFFKLICKTPVEGAQTTLYCALAPELEHVSGVYFSDCRPKATTIQALDDELAEKLWAVSVKLTGIA